MEQRDVPGSEWELRVLVRVHEAFAVTTLIYVFSVFYPGSQTVIRDIYYVIPVPLFAMYYLYLSVAGPELISHPLRVASLLAISFVTAIPIYVIQPPILAVSRPIRKVTALIPEVLLAGSLLVLLVTIYDTYYRS
ncbi:hypothetical protein GCM10009039_07800 [Halocalculus aciditolerans]|uniref:Uncharacterized protein n=1 Tax=Halocalculus aciditolerans TaxID=1383812 RepID=A0A830F9B4_9EURY|nr:hypothetical protein GCM10009039_07800 [Halocalculus aciditolerans]